MEFGPEENLDTVPMVHPATRSGDPAGTSRPKASRWRRTVQVGVALGVAAGVGVGATALASAATSSGSGGSSSTKTTTPPTDHHSSARGGPLGRFGAGFGGIGFGGLNSVLHGEVTVKGPNGADETIEIQTGTVTSVKDVSGSTYSLVVTSSDKTALTYAVDSSSSVNGGELGISSVKSGDNVSVIAVVSKGTATVKSLTDLTKLQANSKTWNPSFHKSGSSSSNTTGAPAFGSFGTGPGGFAPGSGGTPPSPNSNGSGSTT